MASYNRVMLMGNLTRDPELRHVGSGSQVASFGLAVNRKWKDKDGNAKEEVLFVDCTAWGKTADVCVQYLKKGRPVFIEGRLTLEQWEDKNGGGKRSKISVTIDQVQFLGGRDDGGAAPPTLARPTAPPTSTGGTQYDPPSDTDADIPF